MRRTCSALGALLGVLLIVAAWGVHEIAPTPEMQEAPVAVPIAEGDWGSGRNIEATVADVAIAQQLTVGDAVEPWRGVTNGVWIVVQIEVQSVHRDGPLTLELEYADLLVPASDRPPNSVHLANIALSPGIATTGWAAFEVPVDMPRPDTVAVRIAAGADQRLDSVLVVTVDLTTAHEWDVFVLEPPTERVRL